MKKILMKGIVSCILPVLFTGCGLSIYEDWQASNDKAITGGGAVAGKDYINGLLPSENSRKYFTQFLPTANQPIETVSRTDDSSSKSGVRFVKNGGIVIPPGTTISYTNKGYCMDPNLPAPKLGEEFQLVPMAQLIPEELQGTYKKLLEKASSGDTSVQFNMQHLVWALRTAGTDAAYANNLTTQQKRILDRCSDYQGQFEDFHATAKSNSKMMKELLNLADSYLNIKIGGVSYKASDLLDPDVGSKKINEHLNQLIDMSKYLPVENTGFNYGELQPGIYTDVKGSGSLQFTARIANSTNQTFVYYPQNFVGQVGSGTKSQGFTFFATANSSMRQRTTQGVPEKVDIKDQRKVETNSNKSFSKDLSKKDHIDIISEINRESYLKNRSRSTLNEIKYINPGYLIGAWFASFNKEVHYGKANTAGIPKTEQEAIAQGWKKMEDSKAIYHRNPDDNWRESANKKYYKKYWREDGRKGSYEAVYGADGKRVDNPRNIGTRNDYHPEGIIGNIGHLFNEMFPYYVHGNTPDDPSSLWRRITGPSWR